MFAHSEEEIGPEPLAKQDNPPLKQLTVAEQEERLLPLYTAALADGLQALRASSQPPAGFEEPEEGDLTENPEPVEDEVRVFPGCSSCSFFILLII